MMITKNKVLDALDDDALLILCPSVGRQQLRELKAYFNEVL
jgi:hypothetical protein